MFPNPVAKWGYINVGYCSLYLNVASTAILMKPQSFYTIQNRDYNSSDQNYKSLMEIVYTDQKVIKSYKKARNKKNKYKII
jgi:hypothetical protein